MHRKAPRKNGECHGRPSDDTISLGTLKATSGRQTYAVLKDLDLTKFRTVTVWREDALVNFATAPLMLHP